MRGAVIVRLLLRLFLWALGRRTHRVVKVVVPTSIYLTIGDSEMKVILALAVASIPLPAGVTAGQFSFAISDVAGNVATDSTGAPIPTQDLNDTNATFPDVPPGDYFASAVRLDTTGAPIGSPVVTPFNVPIVPMFDAPASITVTVS